MSGETGEPRQTKLHALLQAVKSHKKHLGYGRYVDTLSTAFTLHHQCTNINCSCIFVTTETLSRFIVSPGEVVPAPPHPTASGQQQNQWM
ncbi:transcriptional regulator [Lelliottia amnigena]|nr:transcriptional regulator [Lelliottia amnigena]